MSCKRLPRTGGIKKLKLKARQRNFMQTVIKSLVTACLFLFLSASFARAQEITAIDFNGDLLGKVIPDGKVVGFDNQLIGNVTADSLIINFDGKLIGGVIPQGIAIGNDAKLLGKVNNDGSVRLPSGQIVGKVLPNGLVVNDYFDIIGAVIFPGLVYSDEGKTVGRITGDGSYANLKGQQIGIVTPDGYAYRRVGNDYVLDGRLISSKMVVSLTGEFIGSVVPGGSISNFDSETIGYIKANGYAYNSRNEVIGRIVKSGYAFDNNGFYLGFVTYNGEVVENEKLVGRLRADGNVVNPEGVVIGYSLDIASTATDLKGKYLGRIMPEGNLARARELSGLVGARGVIVGADGTSAGQIVKTGPVFDFRGMLRGHALNSGSVIALNGTPIGYMVGAQAYDLSGRIIGAVLQNYLAFDNENALLGLTGIDSAITSNNAKSLVSPFGYVFNPEGELAGAGMPMGALYSSNGSVIAQTDFSGSALADGGNVVGKLTGSGFITDHNQLVGKNILSYYAVGSRASDLGSFSEQNLIMDKSLNIIAKVLPDSSAVAASKPDTLEYMPQIGNAYAWQIALGWNGGFLGYADITGAVNDLGGSKIGRVAERGLVIDNSNIVIGYLQGYASVITDACTVSGVVSPRGDIQNFRGIYLGKMLANGQALSDSSSIIGYANVPAPVIDFSGNVTALTGLDGYARNFENGRLGCIDRRGRIHNADKVLIGKTVEYVPVINFNGEIVGRTILDGKVVDKNNIIIGYQQPDENVNSDAGLPLGGLFKYKVAFNLDNKFIGRVLEDGSIVNDKLENIGKVNFDGYVLINGQKAGYALYDFYVYDDKFDTIGFINRNGEVISFSNQNLGTIDRGFLLDKNRNVIGRGNRDYIIRDEAHLVVGELAMNGDVLDRNANVVGKLAEAGEIRNRNNEVIATAGPLQYYSKVTAKDQRKMVFDKDGNFLGYLDENGNLVDKDGNIIGRVDENGNLIDTAGTKVGSIDKDGKLIDNEGNVVASKLNQKEAYDKNGNLIGYADENGVVRDLNGKVIGQVNEEGNVIDANGNIIGGIGANWYEKAPAPQRQKEDADNPALALLESKGYRKSLGVALTPDGEYLGEILEDGSVVDEDGNVIGRRMPDGLVIDDDGTLVGIEEIKKPDTSGMFVPPGTFGPGGAYGTGTGSAGNLGPGGGYGPGERYDPSRRAALNAAMQERRKNITVGKISNGMRKEAFDGMQKDWSEQGIPKVISSWRVDLSEMIFADKPIPAVIARAIDSNNPAPITAFVERNVYAEEGRNVIIPAGSRLMGTLGSVTASSEATSESARVQISWERLVRPDGSIFVFQGLTADAQGRAGALGYVDQQLFKKYTLPVLTTSLTSATSYFMAPKEDSKYDTETPRQQAANDARQNFLNEMNQIFDEILADKSSIKPMTYIPAGTRIIVFPNTDLWLRTVERDNDESAMLQKPKVLIDDGKAAAEKKQKENEDIRKQAGTVVNSDVVYEADDAGVEAQKATPLLPAKKKKPATGAAAGSANYIAPPPPPSPSYNSSTSNTSSGSSTNNSGVPALF